MKEKTKRKTFKERDIKDAVLRRALGYDATEVIEEYSESADGEIKLVKRKVTTKNVPPDITAIKILWGESTTDISNLSDEDLESEKQRLLKMLSQEK